MPNVNLFLDQPSAQADNTLLEKHLSTFSRRKYLKVCFEIVFQQHSAEMK